MSSSFILFKSKKTLIFLFIAIILLTSISYLLMTKTNLNPYKTVGEVVDEYNGVKVYYNGGVNHVEARNLAPDGYNLGLKYQCVEFIKRYYYQVYGHKMPDSYGHAKSFFNPSISDGKLNKQRNLLQYHNGSATPPQAGDIIVFDSTLLNRYGHVAIISQVTPQSIEIIQQNPGPFSQSRVTIPLSMNNGQYYIQHKSVLGYLRKTNA